MKGGREGRGAEEGRGWGWGGGGQMKGVEMEGPDEGRGGAR